MEEDKLKVLIVQPHLSVYGGAEIVVAKLANCLKEEGVEVDIITLSLSEELSNIIKDTKVVLPEKEYIHKVRSISFWDSLGIINEIVDLTRLLRRYANSYTVINVHNFPATWAIKGLNKPIIWMCNEPPDLYCNPNPSLPLRLLRRVGVVFDRLLINRYVQTICVADNYNAKRVFQRYGRKTEIVPYGIDYDFFSRADNDNELSKRYDLSGSYVLVQVGVLTPEKNQLESIKVVDVLKDFVPSLKLILAGRGTGAYEESLKEHVYQNNISDRVIFTGHLSKEEVRALYHLCDVALFPVKSQGGWLSPFEVLSTGKPIIVSQTMGAAELIKKENIGIVTDNFPEAVKDIYLQSSLYKEMAQKGKKWVAENLTWKNFSVKMLNIFKGVL